MSIMGYRDMSSAKAGIECTTGTLVLNQGFCQTSAAGCAADFHFHREARRGYYSFRDKIKALNR